MPDFDAVLHFDDITGILMACSHCKTELALPISAAIRSGFIPETCPACKDPWEGEDRSSYSRELEVLRTLAQAITLLSSEESSLGVRLKTASKQSQPALPD